MANIRGRSSERPLSFRNNSVLRGRGLLKLTDSVEFNHKFLVSFHSNSHNIFLSLMDIQDSAVNRKNKLWFYNLLPTGQENFA